MQNPYKVKCFLIKIFNFVFVMVLKPGVNNVHCIVLSMVAQYYGNVVIYMIEFFMLLQCSKYKKPTAHREL